MNLKEIKEKTEFMIVRESQSEDYDFPRLLHLYSILDLVNSLDDKMKMYTRIYEGDK